MTSDRGKFALCRKDINLVEIETLIPENIDDPIKYILENLEDFVDGSFIQRLKAQIARDKKLRRKQSCVPVSKTKRGQK